MIPFKILTVDRKDIPRDLKLSYIAWIALGFIPLMLWAHSDNALMFSGVLINILMVIGLVVVSQYLAFRHYRSPIGRFIWDNQSKGKILVKRGILFYIFSCIGLFILSFTLIPGWKSEISMIFGLIGGFLIGFSTSRVRITLPK